MAARSLTSSAAAQTESQAPQPAPALGDDPDTSDILVEALIAWGATHAFGVVGDGIDPVIEALRKRQD